MPRSLRHVEPGVPYELTHRTRDGRFAFVPTEEFNNELLGVLGDAQLRWPQVKIHQMTWLSNHTTKTLSVDGPHAANALAEWSSYVFGETAKVAQAIHGLKGEIWESTRYRLVEIEDDTRLRDRSKYTLAQAPAAGLVARPAHWPGINSCDAVCRGGRLRGYRGSAALRRRARLEKVSMASIAPAREVIISPLPSHADWTEQSRQSWHRGLEREAVAEAAAENCGRGYRSPEHFRTVSPHTTVELVPSDAPSVYVAKGDIKARQRWRAKIQAFTEAWRAALASWINGRRACFPACGWVPYGACHAPSYPLRE
jgi:hypothetical protein